LHHSEKYSLGENETNVNGGLICELATWAPLITPYVPFTSFDGDPGAKATYRSGLVLASPLFVFHRPEDKITPTSSPAFALSSGAVVGIIVGVVIAALLLGTGGILFALKSRRCHSSPPVSPLSPSPEPQELSKIVSVWIFPQAPYT